MSKKFLLAVSMLLVLSFGLSAVVAQDDVPRGGTVTVSHEAFSTVNTAWSPFAPNPNPGLLGFVYEPLLVWNEVTGEIVPWLATGYEYSDDLLSVTFTIREGVLWSDGEPFSADDVIFSFNLIQEYTELDRGGLLGFVSGVEKVDDTTIRFDLSEVFTQAHVEIGEFRPVPEHIWSEVEDPVTYNPENPVATGPFANLCVLEEQVFELCRNENYWQEGRPYVDSIRYPAYPGNEQSNLAMVSGEIDWAGHFVPDVENTYVAADPEHFNYYFWPGGGTVNLYLNTTKEPFSDVAFRQAVSQLIDYQSVVDIGMYGYTIPSDPTGLGPRFASAASQEALDTAAEMGLGTYDAERAAATLDEAGYVDADGDGWRDNLDGSALAFNVQVVNGWTDWVTSVQIITQNMQDVGLNAQVVTPEFGEWLNNLQTGDYDVSIGWSSSGFTPWNYYRDIMDSTLIGSDGLRNATTWAGWTSEETDELLAAFTSTADEAEQTDILNQIQQAFVENVVVVPLFPGPTWYEWNTTRFTGFPTEDDYYAQGSPWSRDSNSRLLVAINIHCVDDTSCGQGE
ncbi:MAG TPA: ABC transporter substrate-binding protein [Oceanobacillus sp.]|nr:ABC transporter substrate-binding protein [Oceanobacillus sp.]